VAVKPRSLRCEKLGSSKGPTASDDVAELLLLTPARTAEDEGTRHLARVTRFEAADGCVHDAGMGTLEARDAERSLPLDKLFDRQLNLRRDGSTTKTI
jgi:hypothetical protein